MQMSEARRGEIALKLIKLQAHEEGIRLGPSFKRRIGEEAKKLHISIEEATVFAELLVQELVQESFGKEVRLSGKGMTTGGH